MRDPSFPNPDRRSPSAGINISSAPEEGLAKQIADDRRRRWLEENREAIEASNAWVAEHGLPLEKYRLF